MGNRIKKSEAYENRFYRLPKGFFKLEKYRKMSLEAKVLYGFLDDRRELSLKNNWVDAEDSIYLIFTRAEVQEMLCLGNKTVIKAFKELRDYGLIEEIRQGLNKPNLIYVCHLDLSEKTEKTLENTEKTLENIEESRTCKNYTSRSV